MMARRKRRGFPAAAGGIFAGLRYNLFSHSNRPSGMRVEQVGPMGNATQPLRAGILSNYRGLPSYLLAHVLRPVTIRIGYQIRDDEHTSLQSTFDTV